MEKKPLIMTHTSYHASGDINHDYKGASGTSHEHPYVKRWEKPNGEVLKEDENGVWRKKDGSVA